ncbi:cytidylate kinase-like family protein [uncultured Tyzzerella sp.]|uniref:cytidylate kinase-like family protein n=1 Tax=uncultured Tyzzerella sp. TaxID=2321398 RepID=UPI002942801D|nr:cytidylate kinase-like family protein [uncultured Tyzzerella sp.]
MCKKTIVTICREFCSGGKEVGSKLASKLECEFYDKNLISLAAKESGFTETLFEDIDEKPTNSFLYSIAMGTPSTTGLFFQNNDFLTNDKLFGIQSEVIKRIVNEKSAVIVGRCADYILREEKNLVKVYLRADIDFRIKRLLEIDKEVDKKHAENVLYKTDKKRGHYYSYYTGRDWSNTTNYDLVINTSKIGIDNSVDLILNYINSMQ